jgi:hypothetical protein
VPRRALAAAAIALAAALGGCASAPPPQPPIRVLEARVDRDHRPTFLGLPLRSGQVILTESQGGLAIFLSLIPERFFRFTHAGIVAIEDGEAWVYDMSGAVGVPCGGTPLDAISGGMRRLRLLDYMAPNLYAEVFDLPPGVDGQKVVAWARRKYAEKVQFDAYFDYTDHEKLFCTEMVELALEAGGKPPVALVPTRTSTHPSLRATLGYLKVPLDTALPAGLFDDPARRVGALGIVGSMTSAACFYEAKRELHRRFTPDQKLGNLFIFNTGDMVLRPELEAFLRAAVHLFDGARVAPSEAAIALAVRELADDTFGPLRPPPTAAKQEKHA